MISQKKRLLMSCKHNLVSSNLVHPIKNAEGKKSKSFRRPDSNFFQRALFFRESASLLSEYSEVLFPGFRIHKIQGNISIATEF